MSTHDLKNDALGTTRLVRRDGSAVVERDTRTARYGVGWLARRLAAHEAAALTTLAGIAHVPRLLDFDGAVVRRSYVAGTPLQRAPHPSRKYFANALGVLRALHRAGVTHNDLAKEANWLVGPDDGAAIVDFQLALCSPQRGARFRRRAYEDLRHFLKHKRTYQPQHLTPLQRRVVATPTLGTRLWRSLVKPAYRLVTRGLLRWPERSGANERGSREFLTALKARPETRRKTIPGARLRTSMCADGLGTGLEHGEKFVLVSRREGSGKMRAAMDICHAHNLNRPLDAAKPYGIRVSIRSTDTFARLLSGGGWPRHHWYATREERDRALADMASEHVYSRSGDKPTLLYEPLEQKA